MPSMIQFWCDSYVWHPIDFFVICDHKIFQIAYNLKRFVSAINFLLCVEKLRIKKKEKEKESLSLLTRVWGDMIFQLQIWGV